jgi:hypothetical protein
LAGKLVAFLSVTLTGTYWAHILLNNEELSLREAVVTELKSLVLSHITLSIYVEVGSPCPDYCTTWLDLANIVDS